MFAESVTCDLHESYTCAAAHSLRAFSMKNNKERPVSLTFCKIVPPKWKRTQIDRRPLLSGNLGLSFEHLTQSQHLTHFSKITHKHSSIITTLLHYTITEVKNNVNTQPKSFNNFYARPAVQLYREDDTKCPLYHF